MFWKRLCATHTNHGYLPNPKYLPNYPIWKPKSIYQLSIKSCLIQVTLLGWQLRATLGVSFQEIKELNQLNCNHSRDTLERSLRQSANESHSHLHSASTFYKIQTWQIAFLKLGRKPAVFITGFEGKSIGHLGSTSKVLIRFLLLCCCSRNAKCFMILGLLKGFESKYMHVCCLMLVISFFGSRNTWRISRARFWGSAYSGLPETIAS